MFPRQGRSETQYATREINCFTWSECWGMFSVLVTDFLIQNQNRQDSIWSSFYIFVWWFQLNDQYSEQNVCGSIRQTSALIFSTGSLRECQGSGVVAPCFAKWRTGNVRQRKRSSDTNGKEKGRDKGRLEQDVRMRGERQGDYQTLSTCTLPYGYSVSVSVCVSCPSWLMSGKQFLKWDDHGQPEIAQY